MIFIAQHFSHTFLLLNIFLIHLVFNSVLLIDYSSQYILPCLFILISSFFWKSAFRFTLKKNKDYVRDNSLTLKWVNSSE